MTRLNAALNQVPVEVRAGSLFEPVAGERFDLVVTQPAVRGLARHRRAAGLPRLRAARRRGGPPRRHAGARAPEPRRLGAGARQLGAPARRAVAGPGRPAGSRAPAATPGWCSGRPPTPRSTSSCGSRTPACTAAPTTPGGTTPGWRGSRSRTSRPWASGGCTCGGSTGRGVVLHVEEWPFEVEQPLGPEVAERGRRTDLLAATDDAALLASRLADPGRRAPGDPRRARRGRPGDDRAPPAARDAPRPAGGHRGGRAGRRLRRGPDRRADPGRAGQLLDEDAATLRRDRRGRGPRARGGRLPRV